MVASGGIYRAFNALKKSTIRATKMRQLDGLEKLLKKMGSDPVTSLASLSPELWLFLNFYKIVKSLRSLNFSHNCPVKDAGNISQGANFNYYRGSKNLSQIWELPIQTQIIFVGSILRINVQGVVRKNELLSDLLRLS